MYRLILLFLCFIAITISPVNAQDCNCLRASLPQFEQLRDNADTVAAAKLSQELRNNGSPSCAAFARSLDIWMRIGQRKLDSLLPLIEEQERFIEGLDCKTHLIGLAYFNYCRYYYARNDYDKFSVYAFKSLEVAEQTGNKREELRALRHLIIIFTRKGEDEKIPAYLLRAISLVKPLEEDYSSADIYNWLAMEYETWYTRIQRPGLLDTSMLYANMAIRSAKHYENNSEITDAFRVHEAVNYHRGDLRKAVSAMDSAVLYASRIKVATNLGPLYIGKALDLLDLGEKQEAVRWADTSISVMERDFKGTEASLGIYREASGIFQAAGLQEKALETFKLYDHVKDSLFTLKRTQQVNELEQRYEKSKNEKTIRELAQQKRIYLLLAATGLFALVGLIFFIRQQSLRNKQRMLETEQRLNRARMNPHFFFNALSSLQASALAGQSGTALASNIAKFSRIMRETLESTYKEYVSVEQEQEFLTEYLELQRTRFPEKFGYQLSIDPAIEPDEVMLPAMILQPFVENSIEHGFTGIDYRGEIIISFTKKAGLLLVHISDNGKGMIPKQNGDSNHISRATQIIRDRIYLLNKKLRTNASYQVADNPDGKGVSVAIELPYLEKNQLK